MVSMLFNLNLKKKQKYYSKKKNNFREIIPKFFQY